MIKAVIFDLGGVVLKGKTMNFVREGEKQLGVKAKQGTEACFDKKLNLGTSSLRAAFERVFGVKMFDHQFLPLIKAWMANWILDKEVYTFAKKLGKNYKVAILSNSELSFEEKYDEPLKKVFSPIIYSHRVRLVKPELEIFRHTLKKLGLQPEECIFVDDSRDNSPPCQQLGIHFILFKDLGKLKKDLELHGVRA